jgi:hypothetical protein
MTGLRKKKICGPQQLQQYYRKPLYQYIYEISLLPTHFHKL